MIPTLSILCVTRGEAHAWPFLTHLAADAWHLMGRSFRQENLRDWYQQKPIEFVLAADRVSGESVRRIEGVAWEAHGRVIHVTSCGIIEHVLDEAIAACRGEYVLRIDDDERCSPAMVEWLASGAWSREPSWAFATAGLWGDEQSVLVMPELWPQYHTRLSRKELSGGRTRIHQPSPHGRGAIAPVVLEHHKFLAKSLATRQAIAERYDQIKPGAGKRCHSTPELHYDELWLAPLGDGTYRSYAPSEVRRVPVTELAGVSRVD